MRSLTVLVCLLFSFSILADNNNHHHQPSVFEVIPLNSPVKGATANFSLKLPTGLEVDKIKVKLVNANDLKKDQKKFEDITVTGNELNVGVSKLPPGFYRLYVKVWDKKNKGEHDFKTKFHDFVRFVIDESLQVPIPDPKIDNANLLGVDYDKDGVPDRVQRWINESYSSSPNIKLALRQYAISVQNSFANKDNKANSISASHELLNAQKCHRYAQLAKGVSHKEIMETRQKAYAMLVNTKERIEAEFLSDEHFHGQSIPAASVEEACSFELQ